MMTDIASTIQCSSNADQVLPDEHESPTTRPGIAKTVPTITADATTLRVMISMMMKIKHSESDSSDQPSRSCCRSPIS